MDPKNPEQSEPSDAERALADGVRLQASGRFRPAVASYTSAIRLDPDLTAAYKNMGAIMRSIGRLRASVACNRIALQQNPEDPGTLTNLGNALADLGEFEEAESLLRRALELAPRVAPLHRNLGVVLGRRGHVEDALESFDQACRIAPDDPDNQWERAKALLSLKDFENGWPAFDWRWQRSGEHRRLFSVPRWDGSPLEDQTLLIHFDVRLSDALKFLRFVPNAKNAGGNVIVECPPELSELIRATGVPTITTGDRLPDIDFESGLAELAAFECTSHDDLPGPIPYLQAPDGSGAAARELVKRVPARLRVGIAWDDHRVAPARPSNGHRLAEFLRLLDVPGVRLFSLQTGAARTDLERELGGDVLIPDLGRVTRDIADVAGCLSSLDLIVTTDNLLANLAGALGKSAWVLLVGTPDFTWDARGEANAWFPSLRGFRAESVGHVPLVFDRVVASLHTLVGQRAAADTPNGADSTKLHW